MLEPWAQRRAFLDAVAIPPGTKQRLLHRVPGVRQGAEHAPRGHVVVIEAIPASNDVNLPGLATTETLTRHVNLNYFSEAVPWEGEERLADADSWRITGNPSVIR